MPETTVADAAALVRAALGGDPPLEPGLDGAGYAMSQVDAWDDERVMAGLVVIESLARQLDAWRVGLVVQVEQRSVRHLAGSGLAARHGCRTARELIRRLTGVADHTVSRWLRLGRAIDASMGLSGQPLPAAFPTLAAAVSDGRVAFDAALHVVDALHPVRRVAGDAAVAIAEEELVAACAADRPGGVAPVDADSVRIQAATWAQFLDQDGAAPKDADLAGRCLRLGGLKRGLVRVQGLLLPEVAAALSTFADSCTNPRTADVPVPDRPLADDAQQEPMHPGRDAERDEQLAPSETRTRAQVLHDVLAMAVAAAGRVADQSSLAGNSPTLLVAIRQDDLAARRGTGAAFTGDSFGGPAPISIDATRQLACSGAVQRVVLDDQGAVVGMWSPDRCFTGQQRRAIALRDGGCVIPGCHVPAGWCEVHHITPHAEDPSGTHTNNGTLLCWFHHRTIETSGWEIRMRAGAPEVRAPAWLRTLTRAGRPAVRVAATRVGTGVDAAARAFGLEQADVAVATLDVRSTSVAAPDRDDGWRRAVGSPTRILDALARRHAVAV